MPALHAFLTLAAVVLFDPFANPADADLEVVGDELRVNETTDGDQESHRQRAVDVRSDGSFVVVWTDEDRYGDGGEIVVRGFDADGTAVGGDILVNQYTTGRQTDPGVSIAPDGSFVVVWQSEGEDGSGNGVFARRYDAGVAALGAVTLVNQTTALAQQDPVVASMADGGFVVAWESFVGAGLASTVLARRFTAGAAAIGDEFVVDQYPAGSQRDAAIARLPGDGFVVVWESVGGQDGSGNGVFGRRFGADGGPLGDEFAINTYTSSSQDGPYVAANAAGEFFVVWESYAQDGSEDGVFGQRFAADGTRSGEEFRVNTRAAGSQDDPAIACNAVGGFVVVWESHGQDGDRDGIVGQWFDVDGFRVGPEVVVNEFVTASQNAASVAGDGSGGFVAVWNSDEQDGDDGGLFARRLVGEDRSCGDGIRLPPSPRPPGAPPTTASDALLTLQAAAQLRACDLCVCDVDGSLTIAATDALILLRISVGIDVSLACPPC